MSDNREITRERLVEALESIGVVRAAWIFGSTARGEARSDSDLDLAVWTGDSVSFDAKRKLRAQLVRKARPLELDIVILDSPDTVLAFEVIRDGRRIFARDEEATDAFEHRVAMRYLDMAYYRDLQRRLTREALE